MTKPVKHCPFCLSKGLFARLTAIALYAFFRLAVLYHVIRYELLIIFACLIQTKCSNFCYLHLFELSFSSSFFRILPTTAKRAIANTSKGDHRYSRSE